MPKKIARAASGDGERLHLRVQLGSGWVVGLNWGPGVLRVDPPPALLMGRLKGMQLEGLGKPLSCFSFKKRGEMAQNAPKWR